VEIANPNTQANPPGLRPFRDPLWYRHSGAVTDRWYLPGSALHGSAMGSNSLTANTLFAWGFWSGRGGQLDRIAISVTTLGSGSQARIGIYTNSVDGANYPTTRLVDSGALTTSTTGFKSATISVYLEPNQLYWLAYVTSATAPTCANQSTVPMWPLMGYDNALATQPGYGWKVAFTFGALPDPFTVSGSVATSSDSNIAVAVRYA
jgi:hypothetical protein